MTDYALPFVKGVLLMTSLIFAVGPQNAMLIRHGLRRDHPFMLAATFTACDFLLITLGVVGVGQYIGQILWLRIALVYGGAAFLFWFSAKSFYAAWRGGQNLSMVSVSKRKTLIATALAVSLLNPGALVDTLIIIGSVSSQYPADAALAFGLGALVFSMVFFFALAAFTRSFAPALNRPLVWRGIDVFVGLVTLFIGLHLLTLDF